MDRHEMSARFEIQTEEWRRSLDAAKAKAEGSMGDAKAEHLRTAATLQGQLDDLKIQAAKTWDVADDTWESVSKDLELKWEDWEGRAQRALKELAR